ncbi:MAG: hypothetical protein GWN00_20370, partial [Aliifodinibius sp.]|nr:hypothetical protein [candidate division Zixibacteria bacterium]NIT58494.1 hypothetical protein [Fodinibius sp.]NIW46208.1 hypothetical protein [Gammaproteobacteria bacterium]NIR65176.1 hypothetical protein [candidate division Zixibacteria bacterium]NIS46908.1 hypothetical protein [candidate division Zixibacteria bacterium]
GDIVVGDGTLDPQLLTVGSDNQVLTADSGETLGMKWVTRETVTGLEPISTQTASTDATIEFTSDIDSTYEVYLFVITNLTHESTTAGRDLLMRVSHDGGSTFQSGTDEYSGNTGADNASVKIVNGFGSEMGGDYEGANAFVYLYRPASTEIFHIIDSRTAYLSTTTVPTTENLVGARDATTAIDGVQFFMNSGNINSGSFKMYGFGG